MKRPFGVPFSAVLLLLGSLFQLVMALMMAFTGVFLGRQMASGAMPPGPAAQMPGWMPIYMFGLCGFFVALAMWGILTAVGLFRLRRWARYSVMIIGAGLALIGLMSLLATVVMLVVPLAVPSTLDASQAQTAQTMTEVAFGVIGFLYSIMAAVGISWLVYFNLKSVRAVFAGEAGEVAKSRRPFLISLLAVLNVISAPCCVMAALLPFPAVIFGLILHGWQKATIYLVFAALQAAMGAGLWRLKEWGRLLALGMMVFGVAQSVIYLVRPSLILQYSAEVNRMVAPMQSPLPMQFQETIMSASLGFSALFCIAIAAILIYYRGAFQHPIEPMQGEATALS